MIKIKTINREKWKRILKRESSYKNIKTENFEGEIGLIHFLEVTFPLIKKYKNIDYTLVANGYYWLQMAPKNKNYWVTAMFNENKEIIQFYFDVTKQNIIKNNGKSYFYDFFLDVVVLPNGESYLLDEDELLEALRNGEINEKEYEMSYTVAKSILKSIKIKFDELIKFTYYCFDILENN